MESRKNGTDEPICRAGIETQMERKDLWMLLGGAAGEGQGGTNWENSTEIYTLLCVK